jgi:hypothetical protein
MARKRKARVTPRRKAPGAGEPALWIRPEIYQFPYKIQVFGENWDYCPVSFLLDGETRLAPARILAGEPHREAVQAVRGEFLVLLNIPGLRPGQHRITAVSGPANKKAEVSA